MNDFTVNGNVTLYTYDQYLINAFTEMLNTFRSRKGALSLKRPVLVVDNRISNSALRLIDSWRSEQAQPVIWLNFEPFYSFRPRAYDYHVNATLCVEKMSEELATTLHLYQTRRDPLLYPDISAAIPPLTKHEFEALHNSFMDRCATDTAARLQKNPKTFYSQRTQACKKLGFKNYKCFVVWLANKEGAALNNNILLRAVSPDVSLESVSTEVDPIFVPYDPPEPTRTAEIVLQGGGGQLKFSIA